MLVVILNESSVIDSQVFAIFIGATVVVSTYKRDQMWSNVRIKINYRSVLFEIANKENIQKNKTGAVGTGVSVKEVIESIGKERIVVIIRNATKYVPYNEKQRIYGKEIPGDQR